MKSLFSFISYCFKSIFSNSREFAWNVYNGTLRISGTTMPDYNHYYRYPSLGLSHWHSQRDSIKKVVIKKGMTCIGKSAFHDCSNLTTITIPNSVMKIGDEAFCDCI
jgi:hypothetical protein